MTTAPKVLGMVEVVERDKALVPEWELDLSLRNHSLAMGQRKELAQHLLLCSATGLLREPVRWEGAQNLVLVVGRHLRHWGVGRNRHLALVRLLGVNRRPEPGRHLGKLRRDRELW